MENPVQKPYIHQEFPKRMYLEGEKENSIVVNDPDEEEAAEDNGYTTTWINHEQEAEAAAKAPTRTHAPKADKSEKAMEAAITRNAKGAGRVKMPPPPKAGEDRKEDGEGDSE